MSSAHSIADALLTHAAWSMSRFTHLQNSAHASAQSYTQFSRQELIPFLGKEVNLWVLTSTTMGKLLCL